VDALPLGSGDQTLKLGLELADAGLSRFESLADLGLSGPQARLRFALVSLLLASPFGFGFPLVSALSHFRQLAHHGAS
jgi:hypothetical protein